MSKALFAISIFSFLIFTACSDTVSVSSLTEFDAWFGDVENGYVESKSANGFIYTVRYKTPAQMAIRELDESKKYSQQMVDSIISTYGKGNIYLVLEISADKDLGNVNNVFSDMESYLAAMNELSTQLPQMCTVQVGDMKFSPVMHHLEKAYEITRTYKAMLVFEQDATPSEFTFIFNDRVFNKSRLKFQFSPKKAPQLPIKTSV